MKRFFLFVILIICINFRLKAQIWVENHSNHPIKVATVIFEDGFLAIKGWVYVGVGGVAQVRNWVGDSRTIYWRAEPLTTAEELMPYASATFPTLPAWNGQNFYLYSTVRIQFPYEYRKYKEEKLRLFQSKATLYFME